MFLYCLVPPRLTLSTALESNTKISFILASTINTSLAFVFLRPHYAPIPSQPILLYFSNDSVTCNSILKVMLLILSFRATPVIVLSARISDASNSDSLRVVNDQTSVPYSNIGFNIVYGYFKSLGICTSQSKGYINPTSLLHWQSCC